MKSCKSDFQRRVDFQKEKWEIVIVVLIVVGLILGSFIAPDKAQNKVTPIIPQKEEKNTHKQIHKPNMENLKATSTNKKESTSTKEEKKGTIREVTMYTSRKEETDSSPCISADGTNICEIDYNVCATNAFSFGTILYIDKLGKCIVKDRMNKRYTNRIDWYAKRNLSRALNFDIQNLNVKVIKNN